MHAIVRVRMPVDCLSVERLLLVIGPYIPKLFAVADRLGVDLEDRNLVDELARVRFDGHGAVGTDVGTGYTARFANRSKTAGPHSVKASTRHRSLPRDAEFAAMQRTDAKPFSVGAASR